MYHIVYSNYFIYYYFFPSVTFHMHAFPYAEACIKTPLQIHFLIFRQQENLHHFKDMLCNISFVFYEIQFISWFSSKTFSTYYGLIYPFWQDKGKYSMALQVLFVHFLAVIIDFCGELAVILFLQCPGVWVIIYCSI